MLVDNGRHPRSGARKAISRRVDATLTRATDRARAAAARRGWEITVTPRRRLPAQPVGGQPPTPFAPPPAPAPIAAPLTRRWLASNAWARRLDVDLAAAAGASPAMVAFRASPSRPPVPLIALPAPRVAARARWGPVADHVRRHLRPERSGPLARSLALAAAAIALLIPAAPHDGTGDLAAARILAAHTSRGTLRLFEETTTAPPPAPAAAPAAPAAPAPPPPPPPPKVSRADAQAVLDAAKAKNGRLAAALLTDAGGGCRLLGPVAATWRALRDAAAAEGVAIGISGCYRDKATQVAAKNTWCDRGLCNKAAEPGHSMHGWGLAVDVAVGDRALSFSDPAYRWLTAHAALFGWRHPEWGAPTGSSPEPWHWEYEG